jgi:predicted nucleic acid-binding protein
MIRIEEVEAALEQSGIKVLEMPREALFLAGKVFLNYRKSKGKKYSALPDFYIGAHAIVSTFNLITRDISRFKTYFPELHLISPGIS